MIWLFTVKRRLIGQFPCQDPLVLELILLSNNYNEAATRTQLQKWEENGLNMYVHVYANELYYYQSYFYISENMNIFIASDAFLIFFPGRNQKDSQVSIINELNEIGHSCRGNRVSDFLGAKMPPIFGGFPSRNFAFFSQFELNFFPIYKN